MKAKRGFRKPTIKDNGRAYVRLFEHFETPEHWIEFLSRYTVQHMPFGMHRNGDCAVRVIDPATGNLAILGLNIPNRITYHTFAAERSFWNEEYASATHRRHLTIEVGFTSPSRDEVVLR
ncbi:hypothetical protein [Burkholderia gladioli]|uniref:hypothetical protein n=1 Tax=Burkholderia gladioli TaxID=28095 RepID=UPI001640E31B|nr:hypothetical protein [Burkholderia gladioli]